MKVVNGLKTGVLGVALLFAFGSAASVAYAEDAVQLQTQQNTQLQTQQRMGPAVPQGDGVQKQVQQKHLYQHQNQFEKQLEKAENGKRNAAPGSGMNSEQRQGNRAMGGQSQGSSSMNRSGGGGKH